MVSGNAIPSYRYELTENLKKKPKPNGRNVFVKIECHLLRIRMLFIRNIRLKTKNTRENL